MDRGWIKLWRKTLDSGILKNPELFTFWMWCLMKASHKEITVYVGNQQVSLNKGEFVFGRRQAAKELSLSEQTIRTCIKSLKSTHNLTIKSTNKFSIISIVNWEGYQSEQCEVNHQINHQINQCLTSNQPTPNPHLTTNKNVRTKEIEELKEKYKWLDIPLWLDFRAHRKKLKAPLTERAEKIILDKLDRFSKQNGNKPNSIIEKTIECGWKGVFLPENNETVTPTKKPITMKDVENGELERNPTI